MQQEPQDKTNAIEWTPKNILTIGLTVLFSITIVTYSMYSSLDKLYKKREKFNAMTLQEIGAHILEENSGTVNIDLITKVRGMYLEGHTIELPYYISEGLLYRLTSKVESKSGAKRRLQEDTLEEDCSKPAFAAFLQKGGVMHYTYRVDKRNNDEYLFDFNNTWEMCTEDKLPLF